MKRLKTILISAQTTAAVAALLVAALCQCYLYTEQPALGTVHGRVIMSENGVPLADAAIYLEPDSPTGYRRKTRSHKGGEFSLNRVPAGRYILTAFSAAHGSKAPDAAQVKSTYVEVEEGRISPVDVMVVKTQPELRIHQGQVIFGTDEKPKIGISGYTPAPFTKVRDTVHVDIWKTRLSAVLNSKQSASDLDSVGRTWNHVSTLPAELIQASGGDSAKRIVNVDATITEGDHEGFFHKRYPLDKLSLGLYLVQLTHRKQTDCTWLLVTNTALVVKRAKQQVVAYVVDMKSGTPLSSVAVRAYRSGNVVSSGTTDANGLTNIQIPAQPKPTRTQRGDESSSDAGDEPPADERSQRVTTVAVRGEDEAVVTRDYYDNEDAGTYVIHSYTDRPIYRPGQRVYFKDIVRRSTEPSNQPAVKLEARYNVPTGAPLTVQMRNPDGDQILNVKGVTSRDGCFSGQVDLDAEAPTGVYSLITKIGGEVHTHDVVIASYRKPEFTAKVEVEKKRYVRGDTVTMTLHAEYYFGSPVVGAKVKYSVYRQQDYGDPNEDNSDTDDEQDSSPRGADASFYGEDVTKGNVQLDDSGKAVITFKADAPQNPEGPQHDLYILAATVTEGEDNEVSVDGKVRVFTGDFDLDATPEGSLASPGQTTHVLLSAIDMDGKPVVGQQLEVEAGYDHWSQEYSEYSYVSVLTTKVQTGADGKAICPITPQREGRMEVKVRTRDAHGNKIIARASIWVEGDEGGEIDTRYADLSLHTDKKKYIPGETARVLVSSMRTGETVLLTIEGERVYATFTMAMKKKSQIIHVPILESYGPNVYLNACYVRDKHFATSEAPLRVNMPAKELNVAITADRSATSTTAKYQPGDPITYTIKTTDNSGKPISANLSFGVVDEAIYALKEDSKTALHDEFYPTRFNAVQTEYSFSIAFLGDADKSEPEMVVRKKFPDTAYWNPDVQTDSAGVAKVTFHLPDNLTTWRATAMGATLDTRVGRTTQDVLVTKDFLVRLEAPRFLTQKDKSRLVTDVLNDTGAQQSVTVRLETTNLQVEGVTSQSITLDSGRHGQMVWPVNTGAATVGEAVVTVKAWSRAERGKPQFTDAVEHRFPVAAHGREIVEGIAGDVASGASKTETIGSSATGVVPGSQRLIVRVTPSAAGALVEAADYLIGYPYGCTEQTMSRFLPDLLVARAMKMNGIAAIPNADKLPKMVRNSILRLQRLQHAKTGGWGWWEHDNDDPWMTGYVLCGLSEAKRDGYHVSDEMLQRGRQAAVAMLSAKDTRPDRKMFLLYGLAMAGNLDVPRKEIDQLKLIDLDTESVALMVLVNKLLGRSSGLALAEIERRSSFGDQMIHWTCGSGIWYWDVDDVGATSMALRAIIAENPADERIAPVVRWLMHRRSGSYWGTTRDTAWALMALCEYLQTPSGHPAGGETGHMHVAVNGATAADWTLNASAVREKELVLHVPASLVHAGVNTVTLARTGAGTPVFYSVELKQVTNSEDMKAIAPVMPATAHLGAAPAHTGVKGGDPENQLVISREYRRLVPRQSAASWRLDSEVTNDQLNEGDRIRVVLKIHAPRQMQFVMLEDPFPAGLEVSERGDAEDTIEWGYWYSSVDVRDNKIAFFMRTVRAGDSVIEYNLRAKTHGSYHAMPALLQAMYSPDMHAESAEDRVMIR